MIELIRVNNPLDRSDQERIELAVEPGITLDIVVRRATENLPALRNTSLAVSVDGAVYPQDQWSKITLLADQQVTIVPVMHGGGDMVKNIVRAVAMIVIAVVAWYAAPAIMGYAAGSAGWAAVGAAGFGTMLGTALVAGSIMFAGSMLLNAVLPAARPQMPALNGGYGALDQSNSYSWNPQTTQQQGTVIPVHYGLCKLTGNVISTYREPIGDKQYLNLLISLGEGQLSDIFDIKINDQPAGHYPGLEIHTRLGKLNQDPVWFFSDTKVEYPMGLQVLPAAPVLYTTVGNDFGGLEVEVTFNGLFYFDDLGNIQPHSVQYQIEYSPAGLNQWQPFSRYATGVTNRQYGRWTAGRWIQGPSGQAWEELAPGSATPSEHNDGDTYYVAYWAGDHSIQVAAGTWRWFAGAVATATGITGLVTATAARQAVLRYTWRMDNIQPGRYDIRVTRITADQTSSRYGDDLYLSAVREIIYDDFEYPYEAMVAIRGLATDQLSGSFRFECKTNGKLVRVYRDGAWHAEATQSPAWVAYDILTQPILDNDGLPVKYRAYDPTSINLTHWRELADYNADPVPNGAGGTEPRLTWNGPFDSAQSMWDAALSVLSGGRATSYWRGNIICLAIDKPVEPSHTFSVGNILKDSFRESWLKMEGRAGKVECDYLDADNNLERTKLTVVNHAAPPAWGAAKLNLQGCIYASEVIRRCRYHLNTTLHLTRSASLTCDVDALPVTMGSVVKIQHDVLRIGEGGRISSATELTITLDKIAAIDPQQSYAIDMVTPNGMVSRTVVGHDQVQLPSGDTVTRLQLVAPIDPVPEPYTVYAFGPPDKISKPWRVVGIKAAGDLKQEFALAEYNATIHNSDYDIPVLPTPSYSTADLLPPVTGLAITERLVKRADGTIDDNLVVSFHPPIGGSFLRAEIWLSIAGGPYAKVGESSTGDELLIPCREATGYTVVARTVNYAGRVATIETSPSVSITTVGKDAPPANCTALLVTVAPQGASATWGGVTDVDLSNYRVKLGAVWVAGQIVAEPTDTRASLGFLPVGQQTIQVKAVDTTGHESTTPAIFQVDIHAPAQPSVTAQIAGSDCILSWTDATTSYALRQYEVRYGSDFYAGTSLGIVTAQTLKIPADWSGDRSIWVMATDAGGNEGTPGGCVVSLSAPSQVQVSSEVIDNNVLLRWTESSSQLPILYYEVRKGASWATGATVGTIMGRFATLFESVAGVYTYWVAAVNTALNTGTPASVTINVAQPPDFVLMYDQDTAWGGTLDHCIGDGNGGLVAAVNTGETFEQHFTSRGWSSPQAQIDAGYPLFLQPAATAGYYEEIIDYGTALAGTMITLTMTSQAISGNVVVVPSISARMTTSDPWTDYGNLWQVFVAGFRYIKVRLNFVSADATDLLLISRLNIRMAVKLRNDAGMSTANAGDASGTWVPFNIPFVDIQSVTVSAQGTTPLKAVYAFDDVPNPTGFYIYLFDQAGNRVTGVVSWSAKGV